MNGRLLNHCLVMGVVLSVFPAGDGLGAPAPRPSTRSVLDKARILGTWVTVRHEANGKHLAKEISEGQVWQFTPDRLIIRYRDGDREEFLYDLDVNATPRTIDFFFAEDGRSRTTFVGIYELGASELKVFRGRGKRPGRLSDDVGRGQVLFVLQRQKK
jgi:uncharacterized protein (TIGR03067 family)